ncbi:olfactory receptor 483-like, partial [Mus caroli]|uniref:Olfactory receptor 483-like n=1 Tax=Mus caroli TaxID=10089 RepID=A0A6P5P9U2_MUSCR
LAMLGIHSLATPPLMLNFLKKKFLNQSKVSYLGCGIQLSFGDIFGSVECFLLATMAYDRFMAIYNPLLYSTKMSTQVCVQLVVGSYIGGLLNASFAMVSFFSFLFCGSNRVEHFFCDFAPLAELSCSDISISVVLVSFSAGSVTMLTVFIIVISYSYILITILKMRSTEGRQKAFSTCTSHLTAVTLFYGTITFIYVMPKSSFSTNQNKVVSVFYMVVIPMLNPLIYSLRNNEIKDALRRHLGKKTLS